MGNFQVEVRWDGQLVAGVSRVTALRSTVEVVTFRDGASGAVHKLPGRSDTSGVSFERGVGSDLAFDLWARGPLLRKVVELTLVDSTDGVTVSYRLHDCWVCEYTVTPDVDTGTVTESIGLSVSRWERVTPSATALAADLATGHTGVVHRLNVASMLAGDAGQSGHRLELLLREAECAGAVLLLDDAEALFTKRTQVHDAHDRYEPNEVDDLLQRLSTFPGQVVAVPPGQPADAVDGDHPVPPTG